MPIDQRRRDEIAAAVAAYDSANPQAPLPRNAVRLLAAMFPTEDVCQRSLQDIAAEGFDRKRLPALAAPRRSRVPVQDTGFRGRARHLSAASAAGAAMMAAAARRCSVPAAPCRWTATPRPASPPTPRLERPEPPAGPAQGPDHPRLPGRAAGAAVGLPQRRDGCCFPSYEAIAAKAGCARSTVAEALKALEWAGVLTWQHRITRIRERCRDLFGRIGWRWRVIRTSNAYVFRDPKAADRRRLSSKSENQTGTQDQEILDPVQAPARDPDSPLERALARFGAAVAAKKGIEQDTGGTAGAS